MSGRMMGVDVGGSGVKGGIVDLATGELVGERHKLATPKPSTPQAVAKTIARVVTKAGWDGSIGCTVPAVVRHGVVHTAANIDPGWIGTDGRALLEEHLGRSVTLLNDADAAGVAEMRFGAGAGHPASAGIVILLTFGTGIGSAVFTGGRLVPNTELGHLEMWGDSAEVRAAANARKAEGIGWQEWSERVSEYLRYVERLFWPDLFVLGGGVSRRSDKFLHRLDVQTPVVPAKLLNNAGIAGAALAALEAASG
jgi:polyphosphate glucokinase